MLTPYALHPTVAVTSVSQDGHDRGTCGMNRLSGGAGLSLALLSAGAFATSGSFAGSLLAVGWTPLAAVTVRVVVAALVLTVPALLALRGHAARLRRGAGTTVVYGVAAVAGAQLCYFNA